MTYHTSQIPHKSPGGMATTTQVAFYKMIKPGPLPETEALCNVSPETEHSFCSPCATDIITVTGTALIVPSHQCHCYHFCSRHHSRPL